MDIALIAELWLSVKIAFMLLVAETTNWFTPDSVIQLVTAGGFGALVWYLVVKHIPGIESRHKTERLEFLRYIEKRDEDYEVIVKEALTLFGEVRTEIRQLREKVNEYTKSR